MKLSPLFLVSALAVASSLTVGCSKAASDENATVDDAAIISNTTAPKLCTAVRGNGEYIVTHFASLARIVDQYGVVDGYAGGSSGSISTFVYESILKNTATAKCGDHKCADAEHAARVSLALKSLEGYGEVLVSSQEGQEIADLVGLATRLQKEVSDRGIDALASTDTVQAAAKLREVLEIPEVKTLINPEVLAMLDDVDHLQYNVNEIKTSITTLGAFSVDDNRLFFRPGVLNWDALALLFGRVGDFYAGYGDADKVAQSDWLDKCAVPAVGKFWDDAAALPFDDTTTCGDAFTKMVTDYRTKARASNTVPLRLSERVGDPSPLKKLISTSVLEDTNIDAYKAARAQYQSGAYPTGSIPFDVKFENVKMGYWGSDEDLAAVQANSQHFGDLKTSKMTSLGNAQWHDILKASPAEPGLSRFVELPDGRFSAGGWSDLAPVLVLKNLGCERVIYVTREGDESDFATKIAKNLGMDESGFTGLFDLGSEGSSFNTSLEKADAVWCTNWNSFTDSQQKEMAADSWAAPLEARPSFDGVFTLSAYPNVTDRTGKVGCTPGISGGAVFPK